MICTRPWPSNNPQVDPTLTDPEPTPLDQLLAKGTPRITGQELAYSGEGLGVAFKTFVWVGCLVVVRVWVGARVGCNSKALGKRSLERSPGPARSDGI